MTQETEKEKNEETLSMTIVYGIIPSIHMSASHI